MAKKEPIKVFIGEHCGPCHEVARLIKSKQFTVDLGDVDVDLIDIESEEGFPEVVKNNLTQVPSARYQGRHCRIQIDRGEGLLYLFCKGEGSQSPAASGTDNHDQET